MEDEKLAAYYDDLTRRGGGAARFKQGLGFSSTPNDDVPSRGSALPSTSSFLSSFIKESSPSKTSGFEKQAQLQSIQNKLSKKPTAKTRSRSRSPSRNSNRRSRSPSRDRIRDNQSKRRSRSPSRDKIRDNQSKRRSRSPSRDKIRARHSKRRSRSRSRDKYSRRRSWSRSRDRRSRRSRSRENVSRRKYQSRSRSRERNRERSRRQGSPEERRLEKGKKPVRGGVPIDFAKLIDGYDNMTPAERVKAKMKLQLSKTAENDEAIGKGSGWERFEFDKDAPLDDEEIEAVEDDKLLVKHLGQSFRYSAVEARKEEEMKTVHDEAMFGAPSYSYPPPPDTDDDAEEKSHKNENVEDVPVASLLSDQVLNTQKKGSWRDRARKP